MPLYYMHGQYMLNPRTQLLLELHILNPTNELVEL